VYVRKQYAIQHRDAQWQINEPVTFHFGDGSNAQLRKAPPGEQLPGGEGIALLFEVEVDCQPSAKRRAMLEALAGGKMPEGSKSLVPDPASPMFWADQDFHPSTFSLARFVTSSQRPTTACMTWLIGRFVSSHGESERRPPTVL
jgi:hypothetical protein